jgi:hypothetical protein
MAWTHLGRVAGCFAFFSLSPLKARSIAFGFSDLSVAVMPAQEVVKKLFGLPIRDSLSGN